MSQEELKENILKVKEYLKSYSALEELLHAEEYAREYSAPNSSPLCDRVLLRAKMHEIEAFVRCLPMCREQTILFEHYIRGHSVEFCGEMLDISRRSAYRVLDRALLMASSRYNKI